MDYKKHTSSCYLKNLDNSCFCHKTHDQDCYFKDVCHCMSQCECGFDRENFFYCQNHKGGDFYYCDLIKKIDIVFDCKVDTDFSEKSIEYLEKYMEHSVNYHPKCLFKAVKEMEKRGIPACSWSQKIIISHCSNGLKEEVKYLLEKGMTLCIECFKHAAYDGHYEMIEFMLTIPESSNCDVTFNDYELFMNMYISSKSLYLAWINHPSFHSKDKPLKVQEKICLLESFFN